MANPIAYVSEVRVERREGPLRSRRIHVTYEGLQVAEQDRDKVDRVLATHAEGCPVARSLTGSIEITTALA